MLKITNPDLYKGDQGDKGTEEQSQEENYFIINNILNKADGNFMSGFFTHEIPNQNLVVGPYPIYEIDVAEIAKKGCNAVVILQTQTEISQREVDQQRI